MCGKCQPAPLKAATCELCGTTTVFTRDAVMSKDPLLCKGCGNDLAEEVRPKPVVCNYSGYVCAYPCGNSRVPKRDHQRCERNTPPDEQWLDAHPKMRRFLKPSSH